LVEFIGKSTFDLVDHGAIDAMKTDTTAAKAAKGAILLGDDWFDSRTRMRSLISVGGSFGRLVSK
jgi:hypothetical protein